jgi:hypothetical protein
VEGDHKKLKVIRDKMEDNQGIKAGLQEMKVRMRDSQEKMETRLE